VDEAHEYRNVGQNQLGILALLEKTKVRHIMTATPLQTSTKVSMPNTKYCLRYLTFVQDLSSMGRLVGIEHFFTQTSYDEERADTAELRRAKAALADDYDPMDIDENSEDPIRETQVSISLRLQGQFEQRVIRRTINSKDWEGNELLTLPPLHEHRVLLTLQPFEQEIHEQISQRLQEE
jgi:TATA-binding protein-associated factor